MGMHVTPGEVSLWLRRWALQKKALTPSFHSEQGSPLCVEIDALYEPANREMRVVMTVMDLDNPDNSAMLCNIIDMRTTTPRRAVASLLSMASDWTDGDTFLMSRVPRPADLQELI